MIQALPSSQSKIFWVYFALLFLCFTNSMYPWFIWNNSLGIIVSAAFAFSSFIYIITQKLYFQKINVFFVLSFFALTLWDSHNNNIFGIISALFVFIGCFPLFLLTDDLNKKILDLTTKFFAIFLTISFSAFLMHLCGLYPVKPDIIHYGARYFNNNYLLFIEPPPGLYDIYIRFRSVFMEPGHLCQGTVLLLIANRFNFKNKFVFIIFTINLFTLSLAAYIIMFLGTILFNFSIKKIKYLFLISLFLFAASTILSISGNSSIFKTFIWDRLTYSEERKTIEGDNRNTDQYIMAYENVKANPTTFLFGDPNIKTSDFSGGNSGYRRYIVTNGIVGIIFAVLFYMSAFISHRKKDVFIQSFLILLLLFPGPTPLWYCVIIPYITSLSKFKIEESFNQKIA